MKRRYRAIGSPTLDQKAQQEAQRAHGCAACHLHKNAQQAGGTEIHHRTVGDLHGNKQLGQDCTVALCSWHHRGVLLPGLSVERMRNRFGASLHHHKRDFLTWVQDVLGERSTAALQKWQDNEIQRRDAA